MPRFKVNRWWILILTLSLGCVLATSRSATAGPGANLYDELGLRDWGSGGTPPPPAAGDPDIPLSSCKRMQRDVTARPAGDISTARAAGDGTAVDSVMMWRIRVALQSLRLWSFVRF